jgi:Asp-tRNA(Asn)/Glu-tRNA(Gln) amidotransferase A subunit family amidase
VLILLARFGSQSVNSMESHSVFDEKNIVGLSARTIVQLIRDGVVTCEAVVTKYLENINSKNDLNAFVDINSNALKEARELDQYQEKRGAIYGLPISVKELIAVKSLRHSSGSDFFVSPAAHTDDSEIARRLRDAGAIFLGTTRMSELGLSYHTLGTVNPRDARLSPGGSSGGEAVASVRACVRSVLAAILAVAFASQRRIAAA